MPMSTAMPRVFLLSLATALSLAACNAQSPEATPAAEQAAADDQSAATPHVSRTAKLEGFIRQHYGDSARLAGNWETDWQYDGETRRVHRSVCAEQPVVSGDQWQQLLAVCGELHDSGHADPGTIDFFVLRDAGDRFEQVAALTDQVFGSSGNPGSVSIIRAGSDFYGFRVEHGWYGQGHALISQDLILPGPQGLVASGSLRSHIDNASAYDCEDGPDAQADCRNKVFDIDFQLLFDQTDPTARVWPLSVLETGVDCGGERVHEAHAFTLDQNSWRYAFPDSLQREGCR